MPDILITTKQREGCTVYRFNIQTPQGTRFLSLYTTVQEWNSGLEFDANRCAELCADAHLEGVTLGER